MREEDIPGIMAIESVSFGRHHWSDESFRNEINNQVGRYYAMIDLDHQKLIGYCGYWLLLDEAHITTIAVHPDCRGLSLGEVQLIHMLDRCMGQSVKWLTLEVRVSNHPAQNLYYKYGFSSDGLRRKYYQDNGEDALIMTTPDISKASFRELFNKNKQALYERLQGFPQNLGK